MKKGKSVKLKLFTPIKSSYGTVDSKNLKSLYINIQSWVTPKYDTDNWNRVVGILSREIKHSVFNSINTEFFNEEPEYESKNPFSVELTVKYDSTINGYKIPNAFYSSENDVIEIIIIINPNNINKTLFELIAPFGPFVSCAKK